MYSNSCVLDVFMNGMSAAIAGTRRKEREKRENQ
jgi:hypothetical protein